MPCPPEGETDCSSTLVSIQPGSNLGCTPGSTEPSGYWRLPKVFTIEENGYLYGSYGQSILLLEQAIANADQAIKDLSVRSKANDTLIDGLNEQLNNANNEKSDRESDLAEAQTELKSLQSELDAAIAERDKLLADFEANGCIEPYSEQCQEYVDGINERNSVISKISGLIEGLESTIAGIEEEIAELAIVTGKL